jgi:thioredoxin-dependent peroxiredoxin
MVEKGDMAPDFELPADDGSRVKLSGLRGHKVVLYFYPKDDTSGCTLQACDLRDEMPRIEEKGAVVLGVSPDPVSSHKKFKAKYSLNFPLLADEDTKVSEAYGVWKEKSMYGRTYMGIERSTFIIDEKGRIQEAWRKVKPADHAKGVLETLGA